MRLVDRRARFLGPPSCRVWHCAACDVWVPRREGDWEVHCRGIRHQRQLLSLRVHGERGRLVLSAFESPPGEMGPGGAAGGLALAKAGQSSQHRWHFQEV